MSNLVWNWYGSETASRMDKAEALVKKIQGLDTEKGCCAIKGTAKEPYYVTMENCTCPDFSIGLNQYFPKPCKHMLAMAIKIGFLQPVDVNAFTQSLEAMPMEKHMEVMRVLLDVTHGKKVSTDYDVDLSQILYTRDGFYVYTESAVSYAEHVQKSLDKRIMDIIHNDDYNETVIAAIQSIKRTPYHGENA